MHFDLYNSFMRFLIFFILQMMKLRHQVKHLPKVPHFISRSALRAGAQESCLQNPQRRLLFSPPLLQL